MISDARQIPQKTDLNFDLCIIGAGAAGISMAITFLKTNIKVCLLESGGLDFDEQTQSLYQLKTHGLAFNQRSRIRRFGGTTNAWVGRWKPLDKQDFQHKSWVPGSGWPIKSSDLTPFYRQASNLLNTPILSSFQLPQSTSARFSIHNHELNTTVFRFLKKKDWKFAAKFHHSLKTSNNLHVFLRANALRLDLNNSRKRIRKLSASTLDHHQLIIKAKQYVLACGGIENARLLLLSDHQLSNGIGNHHDQVGRYFMDHPKILAGKITHFNRHQLSRYLFEPPQYGIKLSPNYQRINHTLNPYLNLVPRYRSQNLQDTDKLPGYFFSRVQEQFNKLSGSPTSIEVRTYTEQAPNPNNRITLERSKDILGLRRANLKTRLNRLDLVSVQHLHRRFGQYLSKHGLGIFQSPFYFPRLPSLSQFQDSSHHMGTTRMGSNPSTSVVDHNCKIHDISNIFMAGSSVFPTGGHANPNATLIALSLRLAKHLKKKLGKKS